MGIVTPSLREIIKVGLINKYIKQCGIELPQKPSIPNFELPQMPNIDMLEEEIQKIQSSTYNVNDSIYTTEYLNANQKYQDLCKEALEIYNNGINDLNQERKNIDSQLDEGAIGMPESYLKKYELDEKENELSAKYYDSIEEARTSTNIDNITKFKRIDAKNKENANKAANRETQSKKDKAKNEALSVAKEMVLSQYADWWKSESDKANRFIKEIKDAYEDTVNLFKQVKQEATDYFKNGAGDEFVEEECDKIDRIYDNFVESFSELGTDIASMVAKIPNPDVIVAGAATGVPNPAQKVMIFMENLKKVLTDIKKISNYIKEIIGIATALGFAISELIPAFKKLCDMFESKQSDMESGFRKAVSAIRKRQKWYAEYEAAEDSETKLAGYMYADAKVDWVNHEISINGYKCYCRKDHATYTDKGVIKSSPWKNGYKKAEGSYKDSSGKKYYYLTTDDIGKFSEYDETVDEEGPDYDVDMGTSYDKDTNTTKLSLADGRTIVIDYLAASGDIIRLDDGSIIQVQ